jgi:TRAP-type mannitol/chloroaromatic compound transport system substrate-binding protein
MKFRHHAKAAPAVRTCPAFDIHGDPRMNFRPTFLVAAAAALFAAAGAAQAQQVVLKVHHFLPATSNVNTNLVQAWCDKVNKESADRLKCQIYPAMTLGGSPPQLIEQARDGVADIVWTLPGYTAGRFPKHRGVRAAVHDQFGRSRCPREAWDYMNKYSLKEFQGHQAAGHLGA